LKQGETTLARSLFSFCQLPENNVRLACVSTENDPGDKMAAQFYCAEIRNESAMAFE